MATRKNGKKAVSGKKESLRQIYARYKRDFTAADLQKYTEIDDDWVPLEQLIAECESIHRRTRPRKKRP